ncbi:MAG TPA: signal peptidase II [Candidatus Cloacimonadota bacterium]|nr:signal peptidase II [Candidatus Cloacimonadota bacterium]
MQIQRGTETEKTTLNQPESVSEIKQERLKFPLENLRYFLITLIVIFFDQLSKILIRSLLTKSEIVFVTPKFFWLTNIENTGAAFSFSLGSPEVNRLIFIVVSCLASVLLIYLILHSDKKLEQVSYSLILGGALGNLIDRIIFGSVTDFLWCDFPDFIMERWPVFNLADSSIVIAITILIIGSIFEPKTKNLEE